MPGGLISAFQRYGLASLAPVVVSIAQFLLQIALLRTVDASAFGLFAFILGLIQFGFALSNALIATPYTICSNATEIVDDNALDFFLWNAAFSILWAVGCSLGVVALGGKSVAWLFGLFGYMAMIRWFGRAYLYALHKPARAAISDFVYAVLLLLCLATALMSKLSLPLALEILCVATAGGILAIGPTFIELQFARCWSRSLAQYQEIWRGQSRWTLMGVLSSEATANAHSYAVSFIAGPATFAPIAAAMMFIKPIMLVITSLSQLERPVMVRQLKAKEKISALRTVRTFEAALLLTWIGTIAIGSAILLWVPRLILKPTFDSGTVSIAFTMWAAISLLQTLSSPTSVLLQAAQQFEMLARCGIAAASISVLAVVMAVLLFPPVYSLVGILLGQLVMNRRIAAIKTTWADSCIQRLPRRNILDRIIGSLVSCDGE